MQLYSNQLNSQDKGRCCAHLRLMMKKKLPTLLPKLKFHANDASCSSRTKRVQQDSALYYSTNNVMGKENND
jgi:hypothetical protein